MKRGATEMQSDDYYLGAFWKVRMESIESCAIRIGSAVSQLAAIDSIFTNWYLKAKRRSTAEQCRFPDSSDGIRKLLLRGRFRRDDAVKSVMENLGFSASAWSGFAENHSFTMDVVCGQYASAPGLSNCFVMSVSLSGSTADRLLRTPLVTRIVQAVVRAFEPERAVFTTNAHLLQSDIDNSKPFAGWITYLPTKCSQVPALPAECRIMGLKGLGSVISLCDDRFDESKPEHISRSREVTEILRRSGLF